MEGLPGTEGEPHQDTAVETIKAFAEWITTSLAHQLRSHGRKECVVFPGGCQLSHLLASPSKPGGASDFPGSGPHQPKGEEPELTSESGTMNKIW